MNYIKLSVINNLHDAHRFCLSNLHGMPCLCSKISGDSAGKTQWSGARIIWSCLHIHVCLPTDSGFKLRSQLGLSQLEYLHRCFTHSPELLPIWWPQGSCTFVWISVSIWMFHWTRWKFIDLWHRSGGHRTTLLLYSLGQNCHTHLSKSKGKWHRSPPLDGRSIREFGWHVF